MAIDEQYSNLSSCLLGFSNEKNPFLFWNAPLAGTPPRSVGQPAPSDADNDGFVEAEETPVAAIKANEKNLNFIREGPVSIPQAERSQNCVSHSPTNGCTTTSQEESDSREHRCSICHRYKQACRQTGCLDVCFFLKALADDPKLIATFLQHPDLWCLNPEVHDSKAYLDTLPDNLRAWSTTYATMLRAVNPDLFDKKKAKSSVKTIKTRAKVATTASPLGTSSRTPPGAEGLRLSAAIARAAQSNVSVHPDFSMYGRPRKQSQRALESADQGHQIDFSMGE